MRKKPNLGPRMLACDEYLVHEPERLMGRWREEYPGYAELRLELGCGKGTFTCDTAESEPEIFLAAVERVPDAMVMAMEKAKAREIKNVRFVDFDAANLLTIFAPGEVDRIYINFPDPWKKGRQAKRRLTAPAFLKLYETVLKPEGEIWFKTDNRPLFDWSLEQFGECGWTLTEVTNDLHANGVQGVMTDYEKKFHAEGVPINRLVAKKERNNG